MRDLYSLTGQPRENKLRIGIHPDERILLAYFVALFDGYSPLTFLDEAVQFIDLNAVDYIQMCGAASR